MFFLYILMKSLSSLHSIRVTTKLFLAEPNKSLFSGYYLLIFLFTLKKPKNNDESIKEV